MKNEYNYSKSAVYFWYKHEIKQGFTLAEVLITLAIVGVIASLTIPNLMSSIGSKQETTQLKKVYATLSQAFVLVQNDYGTMDSVFSSTGDFGPQSMNIFATKLNVIKNCGAGLGCWYDTQLKLADGSTTAYANYDSLTSASGDGKAMLADGSMLDIYSYHLNCTYDRGTGPLKDSICATLNIDVNGSKGPNVMGKDMFRFWITKTGIQPFGTYGDGFTCGAGTDWFTSAGCSVTVLLGQ